MGGGAARGMGGGVTLTDESSHWGRRRSEQCTYRFSMGFPIAEATAINVLKGWESTHVAMRKECRLQ
ncbi:unnamed protein product [Lota lota]